uniref:Transmembrane protein n=1 Tax=Grammatophora oceanica TaxID=210454 RepID=A0A7S1UNJ4_9STRA|mmetsp:Transcript_14069/g.20593  ORF Transcript_14069/g.20593 Transcript_14069/m.20593 type:complete len:794 (+) Transcript_14069:15-2396(+)
MEIDDVGLISTEMAPQTAETDESEQGDSIDAPNAFDSEENDVLPSSDSLSEEQEQQKEFRTHSESPNPENEDTATELTVSPIEQVTTRSPVIPEPPSSTTTDSERVTNVADKGENREPCEERPTSGTFAESRGGGTHDHVDPTKDTTTFGKANSDARGGAQDEGVASTRIDGGADSPSPQLPSIPDKPLIHPHKRVLSNDLAAHQPEDLHQSSQQKLAEEMPPNIHPPEEKLLDVIIERNTSEKKDDGSVENDLVPIVASRTASVGSPENSMLAMGSSANFVAAPPVGAQVVSAVQPGHSFYSVHHTGPMPVPTAIFAPMSAPITSAPPSMGGLPGGRRKIVLRLEEDVSVEHESDKRGFFFRRKSSRSFLYSGLRQLDGEPGVKRGKISVSWFEGTSSTELQEHVRRSVIRKMELDRSVVLDDLRIIDESMDPPEEIVLSPYIPDGSEFLLRFSTKSEGEKQQEPLAKSASKSIAPFSSQASTGYSVPVSPSAAPSPFPSNAELNRLNDQLLQARLGALKAPTLDDTSRDGTDGGKKDGVAISPTKANGALAALMMDDKAMAKEDETASKVSMLHEDDVRDYAREDQVEQRLRQLADLLASDRKQVVKRHRREKRQVVFVLANYFVLFLSLIAIMAEIQARLPGWASSMEKQLKNVQKCATDRDALFECVSTGDFAGLIAALVLTVSRSPATNRLLLFGFDTPKRLWTVVYEAMVTAICWGASYMFIRRGMNPDTRKNFLRKYWKDAVYGSLAGFNASFLKAILKNLLPQEAFEDALQERQLKILSWLPSFH